MKCYALLAPRCRSECCLLTLLLASPRLLPCHQQAAHSRTLGLGAYAPSGWLLNLLKSELGCVASCCRRAAPFPWVFSAPAGAQLSMAVPLSPEPFLPRACPFLSWEVASCPAGHHRTSALQENLLVIWLSRSLSTHSKWYQCKPSGLEMSSTGENRGGVSDLFFSHPDV